MDSSFIPKLAPKARLRFDRHSGGWMILYPERGLALNDSAAAIAKKCDGTRTIGAIIAQLALEFDADADARSNIEKDVYAFVDRLAKKGLLEQPPIS